MIERINFSNSTIVDAVCAHKINELVDIVNSVARVQEKLIDSRFVVETIDPEGMEYIKLDNDSVRKFLKEHPEYKNNGVIEIQKKEPTDPYAELTKTKQALDIAVDALNKCHETFTESEALIVANKHNRIANKALDQIKQITENKGETK